jgi:hypothetical protein
MADERIGLDTEEQRRRYHKAQLGELEKFAGAAMRDIKAAESRGEARGRAAVLAEVAKVDPWRAVETVNDERGRQCMFCNRVHRLGRADAEHFAHCLFQRAHAAGVAAPEER